MAAFMACGSTSLTTVPRRPLSLASYRCRVRERQRYADPDFVAGGSTLRRDDRPVELPEGVAGFLREDDR